MHTQMHEYPCPCARVSVIFQGFLYHFVQANYIAPSNIRVINSKTNNLIKIVKRYGKNCLLLIYNMIHLL